MHVLPEQPVGLPGEPVAVAHLALGLHQAPCGGEHQREGEVGGGLREHAGRVADRDAALGCAASTSMLSSRWRSSRSPCSVGQARSARGRSWSVSRDSSPSASRARVEQLVARRRQPPAQTSTSCSAASRSSAPPGSRRVTKHLAIAQVLQHRLRRQVARRAGHRAAGVGARAGQVEALDAAEAAPARDAPRAAARAASRRGRCGRR